jgi:hypothetical protein
MLAVACGASGIVASPVLTGLAAKVASGFRGKLPADGVVVPVARGRNGAGTDGVAPANAIVAAAVDVSGFRDVAALDCVVVRPPPALGCACGSEAAMAAAAPATPGIGTVAGAKVLTACVTTAAARCRAVARVAAAVP